ncbi:DNA ligase III [Heliothis zea nudivirus]|uniref:DNA ligase n=1 Tax=Heliothis zea nudivirus 1 TaxID=3116536 RepID=Q8JKS5_9VIRU|nr:DNA ligase III [Heliothis zea nudivirus]AAN04331.1 DNA ligase III [Heliothis zea nudivirus]
MFKDLERTGDVAQTIISFFNEHHYKFHRECNKPHKCNFLLQETNDKNASKPYNNNESVNAEAFYRPLVRKEEERQRITMPQVDEFLSNMADSSITGKHALLYEITRRCNSMELKYLIRIMKRDLKINAGSKCILEALSPTAYLMFQLSKDFKLVLDLQCGEDNASTFLEDPFYESGSKTNTNRINRPIQDVTDVLHANKFENPYKLYYNTTTTTTFRQCTCTNIALYNTIPNVINNGNNGTFQYSNDAINSHDVTLHNLQLHQSNNTNNNSQDSVQFENASCVLGNHLTGSSFSTGGNTFSTGTTTFNTGTTTFNTGPINNSLEPWSLVECTSNNVLGDVVNSESLPFNNVESFNCMEPLPFNSMEPLPFNSVESLPLNSVESFNYMEPLPFTNVEPTNIMNHSIDQYSAIDSLSLFNTFNNLDFQFNNNQVFDVDQAFDSNLNQSCNNQVFNVNPNQSFNTPQTSFNTNHTPQPSFNINQPFNINPSFNINQSFNTNQPSFNINQTYANNSNDQPTSNNIQTTISDNAHSSYNANSNLQSYNTKEPYIYHNNNNNNNNSQSNAYNSNTSEFNNPDKPLFNNPCSNNITSAPIENLQVPQTILDLDFQESPFNTTYNTCNTTFNNLNFNSIPYNTVPFNPLHSDDKANFVHVQPQRRPPKLQAKSNHKGCRKSCKCKMCKDSVDTASVVDSIGIGGCGVGVGSSSISGKVQDCRVMDCSINCNMECSVECSFESSVDGDLQHDVNSTTNTPSSSNTGTINTILNHISVDTLGSRPVISLRPIDSLRCTTPKGSKANCVDNFVQPTSTVTSMSKSRPRLNTKLSSIGMASASPSVVNITGMNSASKSTSTSASKSTSTNTSIGTSVSTGTSTKGSGVNTQIDFEESLYRSVIVQTQKLDTLSTNNTLPTTLYNPINSNTLSFSEYFKMLAKMHTTDDVKLLASANTSTSAVNTSLVSNASSSLCITKSTNTSTNSSINKSTNSNISTSTNSSITNSTSIDPFQPETTKQTYIRYCYKPKNSNKVARIRVNLSSKLNLTMDEPMATVAPMLAAQCKSIEVAFKKFPNGMMCEYKYDGERVQIHKSRSDFKYYSRSLKCVPEKKLGDLTQLLQRALPSECTCILDCELLMMDTDTGKVLPFDAIGVHKRKAFKSAKVCIVVFDCMYFNGRYLYREPLSVRRDIIKDNLTLIENRIVLSEQKHITSPGDLMEEFKQCMRLNMEGLMLKCANSCYMPGKRRWLKMKRDYFKNSGDTADLVILGAWYGTGRLGGLLSVFLMGCLDGDCVEPTWVGLTKVHAGLNDVQIKQLNDILEPLMVHSAAMDVPWRFVNVKDSRKLPTMIALDPKQMPVLEVLCTELTASLSFRFPRVIRIRSDKDWTGVTSLRYIKELASGAGRLECCNDQKSVEMEDAEDV